jgi:WD40 repeat protein
MYLATRRADDVTSFQIWPCTSADSDPTVPHTTPLYELHYPPEFQTAVMHHTCFSSDCRYLASTAVYGDIIVWEVATQMVKWYGRVDNDSSVVVSLFFRNVAERYELIVGNITISRVIDAENGQLLASIHGFVKAACPKGDRLVVASTDNHNFDEFDGRGHLQRTYRGIGTLLISCSYNASASLFVSASGKDESKILVWDTTTAELLFLHDNTFLDGFNSMKCWYCPDPNHILLILSNMFNASPNENTVVCIDAASGSAVSAFRKGTTKALFAFQNDMDLVAVYNSGSTVTVYHRSSMEVVCCVQESGFVGEALLSPIGSILL